MNGHFYAFYLSNNSIQLVTLDLTSGNITPLITVDPAAGLIFGAAPTPEPGKLLLLGSGLAGTAGLIRKRRQQRP